MHKIKEIVLCAFLGAILFVTKMALAPLPNIEPVSLLIIVYASILGKRVFYPIYLYVMLEIAIWGLNIWSLCYLYVWAILGIIAILLKNMRSRLSWAVLSGAFGLFYGALCALAYGILYGWSFAFTWWVSGIPFDVAHCIGNFVMILVLYEPCKKILKRLWTQHA